MQVRVFGKATKSQPIVALNNEHTIRIPIYFRYFFVRIKSVISIKINPNDYIFNMIHSIIKYIMDISFFHQSKSICLKT